MAQRRTLLVQAPHTASLCMTAGSASRDGQRLLRTSQCGDARGARPATLLRPELVYRHSYGGAAEDFMRNEPALAMTP